MASKRSNKIKTIIRNLKWEKKSDNTSDLLLSQSIEFNELYNPHLIRKIAILLVSLFVVLMILAAFTPIKEAAVASGDIEPEGQVVDIQHFDGGIVTAVKAYEGDSVKQGDTLLLLDGIGAKEDLARYRAKNLTLALQAHRISSIIQNTEPRFKSLTNNKAVIKKQMEIYLDMLKAQQSEKKVISQQLEQKKYLLQSYITKKDDYKKEIDVAKQILSMYQKLSKDGHSSKIKLLEEKRRLLKLERDYRSINFEIQKIQKSVDEFQSRLSSHDASYMNNLNQQLEKIENEINENNEQISKLSQKAGRLKVVATRAGIIKSSSVKSTGEVIQPGTMLFEIIPFTTPLIANLRVKPSDIGHIKLKDKVRIKISAFDYIKYGVLNGRLYFISASTFTDDNNNAYYKAKVRFDKNYFDLNGKKHYLMPGMIVKGEIITGERTILQYLLKPIFRSFDSGLMER